MLDQTERLRRMCEYSWHVMRAENEHAHACAVAELSPVSSERHEELARLHLDMAHALCEAWQIRTLPVHGEAPLAQALTAYKALLDVIYAPAETGGDEAACRALLPWQAPLT